MGFFQEHYKGVTTTGAVIALVVCAGLGAWAFTTTATLRSTTEQFAVERTSLGERIALLEAENKTLSEALYSEQQRNEEFEDQLDDLEDTLGVLEKLSETDPELLQKYSKVYFLNEHYAPPKFKKIPSEYGYPEDEVHNIHADVYPFLEDLMEDAQDDDIDIRIASAFRSYTEQTSLKSTYTVTYGSGANTFSADQGYSEHQLGTTVDFTTTALNGGLNGFHNTPAYEWLEDNAYKYGFVLSYPEGNAYYQFEPWHWRFVGKDLARYLDRRNMHFYDMSQRDIDEYLVEIFD